MPGFPYLSDFSNSAAIAKADYVAMPISVFDHWLTEAECARAAFTYRAAAARGELADYLNGERRFVSLYGELARDGASIVRFGAERVRVRNDSRRFREIVISSLREYRLMDLYFPSWKLRAIGNYDRTDWLFLRDPDTAPAIADLVRRNGLFVLPG